MLLFDVGGVQGGIGIWVDYDCVVVVVVYVDVIGVGWFGVGFGLQGEVVISGQVMGYCIVGIVIQCVYEGGWCVCMMCGDGLVEVFVVWIGVVVFGDGCVWGWE